MITQSFGQYIRDRRKERGLTIRDLEAMSGVSNAHLSYIETGKRRPPAPDTLQKLSGPLGVSYEELMVRAGHIRATSGNSLEASLKDSPFSSDRVPVIEKLIPGLPLEEHKPVSSVESVAPLHGRTGFYTWIVDNSLADIGLKKGTRILVAQQPPENGDIAVCTTKTQVFIRRLYYVKGTCVLQAAGRDWEPIVCDPQEITVMGKVILGEVEVT